MKFFGGMEGDPRTNRLDFGGDRNKYPDPRFLDADQDLDPEIFNGFLIKFLVGWDRDVANRLVFSGDLNHNPDPAFPDQDHNRVPGIFKGFFIYYCDSYTQPRIKHDNPRWRYALCRLISSRPSVCLCFTDPSVCCLRVMP